VIAVIFCFPISFWTEIIFLIHTIKFGIHRISNTEFASKHQAKTTVINVNIMQHLKVKVKVTIEQATKPQKGSRGIALLFL